MDETEGFQCLGLSNWTICSPLSQFCSEIFSTFSLSYWGANFLLQAVEKLVLAADSSCRTQKEQMQVLNSARLLTRIIPYIFEEPEWRNFFW